MQGHLSSMAEGPAGLVQGPAWEKAVVGLESGLVSLSLTLPSRHIQGRVELLGLLWFVQQQCKTDPLC